MSAVSRLAPIIASSICPGLISPSRAISGNSADGPCDFVTRTVVEGNHQLEAEIAGSLPLRLLDESGDVRRQSVPVADDRDPHPFPMQPGDVAADEQTKQAEKELDLGGRP